VHYVTPRLALQWTDSTYASQSSHLLPDSRNFAGHQKHKPSTLAINSRMCFTPFRDAGAELKSAVATSRKIALLALKLCNVCVGSLRLKQRRFYCESGREMIGRANPAEVLDSQKLLTLSWLILSGAHSIWCGIQLSASFGDWE
jgi:hypothetical protein